VFDVGHYYCHDEDSDGDGGDQNGSSHLEGAEAIS
jgi:hypothetical protein